MLQNLLQEANRQDQDLVDWVDAEVWPRQKAAYSGKLDQDLKDFRQEQQERTSAPREPLFSKFHRNIVLKPLRRLLIPPEEPSMTVKESPWL
ncbi:MAG: hypothetical protein ACO3N7_02270 [Kiritimatiellia bacterium]